MAPSEAIAYRKSMATILGAKSISQARKAWVQGYRWDVQVRPDDEIVSREAWDAYATQIESHLRKLHERG